VAQRNILDRFRSSTPSALTHPFEFGHQFVFINIRQRLGQAIRRGLELRKIGRLVTLSARGNIDAQGFSPGG
jgi:hypothetical protein